MTIISVPLKQRSVRDSLCVKVADLCGTKSPLQRHQPLKARPPQHSIDLRNKPIFFIKKKKEEKKFNEGVYGAGPDRVGPHDWT